MPSKTSPSKKLSARESEGDVFYPEHVPKKTHTTGSFVPAGDLIVVTPPAEQPCAIFELEYSPHSLAEIQEDSGSEREDGDLDGDRKNFLSASMNFDREYRRESQDDSEIDGYRTVSSRGDNQNTLSTSRSWSNIALAETARSGSGLLQLPKSRKAKRSFSAEFGRVRGTKNTPSDRGSKPKVKSLPRNLRPIDHYPSPRPGRKGLAASRTRSQSPVASFVNRLLPDKVSDDGSREGGKAPWAKTLRFLSRKPATAPVQASQAAQKEFIWQDYNISGSIVADGTDTGPVPDMIVNQNPVTDNWQPTDTNNGLETPMVATRSTPLGSTGGSTSSGNGTPGDVPDGLVANRTAIEHLQQKILKISEQIKIEQASRDENVAEYLKLARDADKQQAARIKSVFEKKNQKSKAIVTQLQKKLESYHRRLKDLESNGSGKAQPKYGLKEVGAKFSDFSGGVVDSVKGSLSGLSQVTQNAAGVIASKPKDIASKFKNKFGSADNLPTLKDDDEGSEDMTRYNSADDLSMSTSGSADYTETPTNHPTLYNQQLLFSAMKNQIANMHNDISSLKERETQHDRVRSDVEQLTSQVHRDITLLTNSLQDEKFRCARLQDQLHDLSELHLRELTDIKQEIASMEEKIEYHAQERQRDIQEALESCQTRIAKMEVQQQHQYQQLVTMEGVENATARALLGKLINLLLSVLAVILVFVSTVSGIMVPFFKSQTRMVITGVCVLFLALTYRNWDSWTGYISAYWFGR